MRLRMKINGSSKMKAPVKYATMLKNLLGKHYKRKRFKMKARVSDKLLQLIHQTIRRKKGVVVVANVQFTELKMTRQQV